MSGMPYEEIDALKNCFVKQLSPIRVYLFGSYATDSYDDESDFDFFIVVDDSHTNITGLIAEAYKSIRGIKRHPVDILVATNERFEARKHLPTIEREVFQKGVLLYAS